MAGSHRWPLLLRMQEEAPGGWALNVWHVAAQLRAGDLDQGFGQGIVRADGSGYRLGPDWATALGCQGEIRREPFEVQKPSGSG
ncbi:MAG: hypothetical protein JSS68_01055 [Actinobacteria bacterium]|nr:hypothetical protein [Actinomycetota bacterium]